MTHQEILASPIGSVLRDSGQEGSVRGLMVRVYPSGKRSFLLHYRTRAGQTRRPKLGEFPSMSLSDARVVARKLLALVTLGEDPKGNWDEKRDELTLNELFERALKEHYHQEKFVKSSHRYRVEKNYRNHVEKNLGRSKLSDITTPQCQALLNSLSATPYLANRTMEVIVTLFNFAERVGIRANGSNPASKVKCFVEKTRDRFATEDEAQKLALILERERPSHPCEVAYLYFLIFTGARPQSIERALKTEISRVEHNGKTYGILKHFGKSSGRTGKPEIVMIPPLVLKVVDSIGETKNGTLFGIARPKHFWERIREEIGAPDLWIRDWRRFFASQALSDGMTLGQIGELLNHTSQQTTMRYAKLTNNSRRDASALVSDKIETTFSLGTKA